MRKTFTISVSEHLYQLIENEVKLGNFITKSEFFRHIFKNWFEQQLQYREKERQRKRRSMRKGLDELIKRVQIFE